MGNKTTYRYDSAGNMISMTDPQNNVWKYEHDPFGRIVKDVDPNGKSSLAEYDELGRNTAMVNRKGGRTEFTYDILGNLATTKDPYGNIANYTYDEAGNKLTMKDPKGNTVSYSYDPLNRLISECDQLGNTSYYGYDSLGRKIWETDKKLHQSDESNVITLSGVSGTEYKKFIHYGYDLFGKLVSVTNEAGNKYKYTYDITGNITSQIDPGNKTILYKYDSFGQLIEKTDGNGKKEKYAYDIEGRLISKVDRNGLSFSYTYDKLNRLTTHICGSINQNFTYTPSGKIKSVTDSSGTTTFEYDKVDNLSKKTLPDGRNFEFMYDEESNRNYMKDPYGGETSYTYDLMNRLTEVNISGKKTTYGYDQNGNRTSILLPNGAKTIFSFDARNLNTKLVNTYGNEREEYTYSYDPNFLQTYKIEPSGRTDYEYDDLLRVVKVTEPNNRVTTYTYDLSGNRNTQKVTSQDVNSIINYYYDSSNRLLKTIENKNGAVTVNDFGYDDNGNQKMLIVTGEDGEKDITTYDYDKLNRLILTKTTGQTIGASYDPFGQRISKTINGVTTKFYNDNTNAVLEVKSGAVVRNVFGLNLILRQDSGNNLYYMYNGHGDVVTVTDEASNGVNRYEYDVFGNTTLKTELFANPYRYSGYYFDSELNYYYLNARYYDSTNARFITEDSITGNYQDPLSLNLYTYCMNNPVSNYDPSGHLSWGSVWRGVKKVGSVISDVGSAIYKGYSLAMTFGQSSDILGDAWGAVKKGASFAWDYAVDNWDTLVVAAVGFGLTALTGGAINPFVLGMITGSLKSMLADVKEGKFSFSNMGKYLIDGVKGGAIGAVDA